MLADLLAWRDGQLDPPSLGYWRTATGEDVDFVVEADNRLLPIEVKATTKPRVQDARHLQSFREEYGSRSRGGLLLHAGDKDRMAGAFDGALVGMLSTYCADDPDYHAGAAGDRARPPLRL